VQEYTKELWRHIKRHEGDVNCVRVTGLMLLLNAPVPCTAPALRGLQMAVEMPGAMQSVVLELDCAMGTRNGLEWGPPKVRRTVGRIGYEGPLPTTAIGNVVNMPRDIGRRGGRSDPDRTGRGGRDRPIGY